MIHDKEGRGMYDVFLSPSLLSLSFSKMKTRRKKERKKKMMMTIARNFSTFLFLSFHFLGQEVFQVLKKTKSRKKDQKYGIEEEKESEREKR